MAREDRDADCISHPLRAPRVAFCKPPRSDIVNAHWFRNTPTMQITELTEQEINRVVGLALAEDGGSEDATTLAIVPESVTAKMTMVTREPCVIAGISLAAAVFHRCDAEADLRIFHRDGSQVPKQASLLEVHGRARAMLTAERVALNLVQRLSGIATLTAAFVEKLRGSSTRILDTRKTTPGLRILEKYAVACGGGVNHRFGLSDMILIKDNHLAVLRQSTPDPITEAVRRARQKYPQLKVEVEVETIAEAKIAIAARADRILLDNMSVAAMTEAVGLARGRVETEASGGIGLDRLAEIAATGVDFISAGALTHSARAIDIGLDFQ
jgi:nicotinate-nucleotide pyrophosphorylase (carboxylating)